MRQMLAHYKETNRYHVRTKHGRRVVITWRNQSDYSTSYQGR